MVDKTTTAKGELVPFSLEIPEYDQNTYIGRFKRFQETCNPMLAFFSNTKINEMRQLLEDQKNREEDAHAQTGSRVVLLTKEEIAKLRRAQTVVSTAIHPDTGEFIPWVCRLSSFLPCNVPIAFGFIIAKPTPFNTIFWQWIN